MAGTPEWKDIIGRYNQLLGSARTLIDIFMQIVMQNGEESEMQADEISRVGLMAQREKDEMMVHIDKISQKII